MQVGAPIPGRIVSLRQVPDLVFSGMIVGAGVALRPLPGSKEVTAVAPISARYSPLCPVVVLDSTASDLENLRPEGNQVEVGDLLFEISAAPAGDPSEW